MKEFTDNDYSDFLKCNNYIELFGKKFSLEKPVVKELEPKEFKQEVTTVFSFKDRGAWATHYLNASYRGNFAPEIARNMILRYTNEGDLILDPMCGSGTSLIESKLLNRNAVGVDINPKAIILTKNRLDFKCDTTSKIKTYIGNSNNLDSIKNESIDFIIAHPPYANIISYSEEEGDLSKLTVKRFIEEIDIVAKEFNRVLKQDHYCAVLIGDTRKSKHQIPLAYMLMQKFLDNGFVLKEDIIKVQWNCQMTAYWQSRSIKENFYLIMHEHLFVFRKL